VYEPPALVIGCSFAALITSVTASPIRILICRWLSRFVFKHVCDAFRKDELKKIDGDDAKLCSGLFPVMILRQLYRLWNKSWNPDQGLAGLKCIPAPGMLTALFTAATDYLGSWLPRFT
jgi:hypothetical protein